jgi:hypothetical protein
MSSARAARRRRPWTTPDAPQLLESAAIMIGAGTGPSLPVLEWLDGLMWWGALNAAVADADDARGLGVVMRA